MDDIIDVFGDMDLIGVRQVSVNQGYVPAGKKMKVGRPADHSIHIPTPLEEMAAEVRTDEAIGAGDEDFHAPPRRAATAAFQARANAGAARNIVNPQMMPITESVM